MRIIKILSLICFLLIGVSAQIPIGIQGRVTDENGSISNALVTLVSVKDKSMVQRVTTDSDGKYFIVGLSLEKYILSASYSQSNKNKVSQNVTVVLSINEVKTVDLQLYYQPIREEVSVIASGTTQSLDEVAKTVNIIDSQQLRDRADFSLAESLRTIPGFRVQQLGGFGRLASIKTRGLRNQDTAVLIDGIRFRDASAITGDASPFLSDFTLTSVDKIEVLRGSGSSLYGTNAIGGTIDFQTPKPQKGPHGQIGGAVGGYGLGRFRANFTDATHDEKFGFNLGVSRTIYAKGIDGQDDAHNTNFQSRLEYNPFAKTNLSGRFYVSDAYVRLNSSPDTIGVLPATNAVVIKAVPLSRELLKNYENGLTVSNFSAANFIPDANDPDAFQKSQFFDGQFVLTQIFSDKLVFQGSYQGLRTQRKNDNGTLGVGFQSASTGIFNGLIQTANGHFNYTPNSHNEVTAGYEYEREKYGNDGLTPSGAGNFFTRAYQSSNTVYAQDLLKFFDGKLQFAGGFRAQFFNLNAPKFSVANAPYAGVTLANPPNAYTFDGAASYFFDKSGTKIRVHAGNGYRVPSLYERFGTFYSSFSSAFFALGDPNLKPEKTIAFDGGIEQNLFKNRAKLSATYFYTKLISTIGFGNSVPAIGTTNRPFGGYLNTKGGVARGAELSGQVKATDSTDIFASYTFTNSDQRAPQVSGNPNLETLGIPKNQFTLVATQRFKRAWVNLDLLATDSYLAPIFSNSTFNTYVYRFKGNRKADLTGGYTFPLNNEKLSLRVYGTIENLFNNHYYENGFRTFDRYGRIGLNFGF